MQGQIKNVVALRGPAGLVIKWAWPMDIAVSKEHQQRVYQAIILAYLECNSPMAFPSSSARL